MGYSKSLEGTVAGPASYTTGGFVIDLSATFSNVKVFQLKVETLAADEVDHEIDLNTPTAGKVTVKLFNVVGNALSEVVASTDMSGTTFAYNALGD